MASARRVAVGSRAVVEEEARHGWQRGVQQCTLERAMRTPCEDNCGTIAPAQWIGVYGGCITVEDQEGSSFLWAVCIRTR